MADGGLGLETHEAALVFTKRYRNILNQAPEQLYA